MWPHPLGSASSANWSQVSLTTGLWGAPQMLWCVLSAGPRFFFLLCLKCLTAQHVREQGDGRSRLWNQKANGSSWVCTRVPGFSFFSFPSLLSPFLSSFHLLLSFSFLLFCFGRTEQRKEKMVKQWKTGYVPDGRVFVTLKFSWDSSRTLTVCLKQTALWWIWWLSTWGELWW